MFIAHLPAGYLLTRSINRRVKTNKYLWLGLCASLFPDIDLLYFYLIDHRQTLHHDYWTHLPLFWICAWAVTTVAILIAKKRSALIPATIIFSNIILHFILDTAVGGVAWLYPFTNKEFFLFTVPATHGYWVWNFILHWTFVSELAIAAVAIYLLWHDRQKK